MFDQSFKHVVLVENAKNRWGLPKGSCEKDETNEDGCIREVREETGYQLTIKDLKTSWKFLWYGKNINYFIVHGIPLDTRFQPENKNEVLEARFFPLNEDINEEEFSFLKILRFKWDDIRSYASDQRDLLYSVVTPPSHHTLVVVPMLEYTDHILLSEEDGNFSFPTTTYIIDQDVEDQCKTFLTSIILHPLAS